MGGVRITRSVATLAILFGICLTSGPVRATDFGPADFTLGAVTVSPDSVSVSLTVRDSAEVQVELSQRFRSRSSIARVEGGEPAPPLASSTDRLTAGEATLVIPLSSPLTAGVYSVVARSGGTEERTWLVQPGEVPVPLKVSAVPAVYPPPQWHIGRGVDPRLVRAIEEIPEEALRESRVVVSPLLVEELRLAPADRAIQRLTEARSIVPAPLPAVPLGHAAFAEASRRGRQSLAGLGSLDEATYVQSVLKRPTSGEFMVSSGAVDSSEKPTPTTGFTVGSAEIVFFDEALHDLSHSADTSRFIAELAMLYFEAPSRPRTVVVLMDALSPKFGANWSAIRDQPIFEFAPNPELGGDAKLRTPAERVPPSRTSLETFQTWVKPNNPLLSELRLLLWAIRSDSWWEASLVGRKATETEFSEAIREARENLGLSVPDPVTFTSSGGAVPVTIRNDNAWPVEVRVALKSGALETGAEAQLIEVPAGGNTVTIPTKSTATGTAPLAISLLGGRGDTELATTVTTVKSTAVSSVAVGIVVIAAGYFLFAALRKKRR